MLRSCGRLSQRTDIDHHQSETTICQQNRQEQYVVDCSVYKSRGNRGGGVAPPVDHALPIEVLGCVEQNQPVS